MLPSIELKLEDNRKVSLKISEISSITERHNQPAATIKMNNQSLFITKSSYNDLVKFLGTERSSDVQCK